MSDKKKDKKIWDEFKEHWDSVEYESLDRKLIQKILGDKFKVPKDMTEKKVADEFFKKVRKELNPRIAFGGMTIDFSKDKTMLKSLFPVPFAPHEMASKLWAHIKEEGSQVKTKKE